MPREKIKLVSTAGTGYFYTSYKNTTNNRNKLVIKKYDPRVQKHVDFEEKEMDSGQKKG